MSDPFTFKSMDYDYYTESLVTRVGDRRVTASILRSIALFLEGRAHQFATKGQMLEALKEMSLAIKNKTEDLTLIGGPLDGKTITVEMIERTQTFLVPKKSKDGSFGAGQVTNSEYSKVNYRISSLCHVYGNRQGSNLYYLNDNCFL
jgi:hypothetical protein